MDGNTEVVKIVRAEVHKAFGPSVTLAPAKKLADGSESVPWSKLSPEEQSKINAQLVQEQLKAATLLTANLGTAAGLESSGKEPAGTSAKSAEDGGNAGDSGDEEGHRAAAGGAEEVDPWAVPTQEVHHRNGLFRMMTLGLHLHSRCNAIGGRKRRQRCESAGTTCETCGCSRCQR